MYRTQCVLALLALYVGLVHCFSWDFVMSSPTGLEFYVNGTITHSEKVSADISRIIYDPVRNRLLFSNQSLASVIYSFDIATKKIQTVVRLKSVRYYNNYDFDPVTETFFGIPFEKWNVRINSFSSEPESPNTISGDIILDYIPGGIAVDSCARYLYWAGNQYVERARFDGSEREVLVDSDVIQRYALAIDQQTQTMYWVNRYYEHYDYTFSIERADLNGKNRKTLHVGITSTDSGFITASKDFIYGKLAMDDEYWQIAKSPPQQFTITKMNYCIMCDSIAANYQVEDQTRGSRSCEALASLLPSISTSVSADVSLLCVHGTQVTGESVCKCTQGYTGERCDVSICQNYCFEGDCAVRDEQPKCRCNAGYSGERCEVYGCQGYCFQGGCSVSAEGQPKCRCYAGYSGERCEVNACQGYCLNDGVCSLNEESEPVCQCTGDYEGKRCEVSVSVFYAKCFQIAPGLSTLRDILDTDVAPVTLDKEVLQLMSETNSYCSLNKP